MAEVNLSGYWKGLAVAPTLSAVVHIFFEQTGNELRGQFEAPDLPEIRGSVSKGRLTGRVDGSEITFEVDESAAERITFKGTVVGEGPTRQMLYGTLQTTKSSFPGGTLTVFKPQHQGVVTMMYTADK